MPHYKDGTDAKVGDVVRGTTFNKKGEVLGILVSITPGTDTCNATVNALARVYESDGQRTVVAVTDSDYSECKALEKVL